MLTERDALGTPTTRMIMLLLLCFVAIPSIAQVPQVDHVFLVIEENHSYGSVVGNSSMPYLNSLISRYGLATQYYSNTHPSIGNYFMLTTGRIITNNDSFFGTVSTDNIVRQPNSCNDAHNCSLGTADSWLSKTN